MSAMFQTCLPPMLDGGKVENMEGTVTGVARSAPEGVWVIGGSIEFYCEYVLYGVKKDRENVRQTLREVQKSKNRRLNYHVLLSTVILLC